MRISLFWILSAVVCAGCRSAAEADREDCARLYQFLRLNYGDYQRALGREVEAVSAVETESPRTSVKANASQLERLRQQILVPQRTYQSIGDRLAAIQLDAPRAEALKRQALHDLRTREKGLGVFTTLLTDQSKPEEIHKAVRDHPAAEDRLGVVMRELEVNRP